jgi:hypothetical protein
MMDIYFVYHVTSSRFRIMDILNRHFGDYIFEHAIKLMGVIVVGDWGWGWGRRLTGGG